MIHLLNQSYDQISCCGKPVERTDENSMGGTFQATAGFQDSDVFQKALKMVLRSILSASFHLSGFTLQPSPTHEFSMSSLFSLSLSVTVVLTCTF